MGKIVNFLKRILEVLLDPRCIVCGETTTLIDKICIECSSNFKIAGQHLCPVCGHPVGSYGGECHSCTKLGTIYYDSYCYFAEYDEFAKTVMMKWKWECDHSITKIYADLILNNFDLRDKIVVFVPDSFFGMLKKGAASMTAVSHILQKKGVKVLSGVIGKRNDLNNNQKNKKIRARIGGVSDKFKLVGKLNVDDVILIDDVYTTGATINFCSRLLKEAGVGRVNAVTIFRSVLRNK